MTHPTDSEGVARLIADLRALRQHHEFIRDCIGRPNSLERAVAAAHVETIEAAIAALEKGSDHD